jgi:hypothetical protein
MDTATLISRVADTSHNKNMLSGITDLMAHRQGRPIGDSEDSLTRQDS